MIGQPLQKNTRIIPVAKHPEQIDSLTLKRAIQGCKRHDRKAQKLLYEQFYAFALKVVFRYIYHYDKAVDTTNDGFVKVFRNIKLFDCARDNEILPVFMGWVRKIMVNTAIDELRKKQLMPEIGALPDCLWEEQDKSTEADQVVLYKEVINEIKKLPPSYRIIFNMHVIDGYSHQEIAQRLGISVGTSKSSLFKARMQLQKFLEESQQSLLPDICVV